MQIRTSKGKTHDARWAWAHRNGSVMIELKDDRRIPEIAADFDGVERVEWVGANEKVEPHEGYTKLMSVARNEDAVLVTLVKE